MAFCAIMSTWRLPLRFVCCSVSLNIRSACSLICCLELSWLVCYICLDRFARESLNVTVCLAASISGMIIAMGHNIYRCLSSCFLMHLMQQTLFGILFCVLLFRLVV